MKVITVCLLIVNLTLWYVECAPPKDDDIFADDMTGCTGTRMKISASMKEAKCMPRKSLVTLTPKIGISYIPNVVSVNRCGGFCANNLSCMPTETILRDFVVRSTRNVPREAMKCHRVYVKEHLRCKCRCKVMKEHCNEQQWYNENKCACECVDHLKEFACDLQKNMVWQPEKCKCTCVKPEEECSTGLEWIPSLCKCAKVM
ncbi:vascular endothelial growth factor A-A-like [Lasioglossum baleicum]|uniref:vascular endothelial growth factor A-A-like n=1 Tax=Lasioglossum baleicum TaxID=434251 RepID=UPI003FCE25DA